MNPSANGKSHWGVIVPMITPTTAERRLDEAAVARLLDNLHTGGVHGVFVLGTTGEGLSVPAAMRNPLVKLVVALAKGRLRVYAGINGGSLDDAVADGNRFLEAGVSAVVAHVPASFEHAPAKCLGFFAELAARLHGNLIIYNMPLTTRVSLPLDVCRETARRPHVVGIKDSENNANRLAQLLQAMKEEPAFSVFVGTGPLMASGLLQGADGIVPSVGNLAPSVCRELYDCATNGHRHHAEVLHPEGVGAPASGPERSCPGQRPGSAGPEASTPRAGIASAPSTSGFSGVEGLQRRMMEISGIYQKGRTLGHSLAALKGAMSWLGLCGTGMFPPLEPVTNSERMALRDELVRLGVLLSETAIDETPSHNWPDHGRPSGSRSGALSPSAG